MADDSYKVMRDIDRQSKIQKFHKPSPDFLVKREHWKNKFVVVARNKKGKLMTWKKWSSKVPVKEERRRFKESNNVSFKKGVKGFMLKNVMEITDMSDSPKKPRKQWQYVIRGRVRDKTIVARSMQHEGGFPVKSARDEALTSFYERLAQSFGLEYDEDEGRKVANELGKALIIKEGVVYYRSR